MCVVLFNTQVIRERGGDPFSSSTGAGGGGVATDPGAQEGGVVPDTKVQEGGVTLNHEATIIQKDLGEPSTEAT